MRWAFQLSSFQKLVTKPLALARHLDDADYLAQIEAVDRFSDNMIAYPGRTFGQLYHRLLKGNALVDGTFDVGERTVSVAAITHRCWCSRAPPTGSRRSASVKASVPLLTGARDVRFEIVPGGHLGMLTGRKARTSTWLVLDEWIDQWSEPEAPAPRRAANGPEEGRARRQKPPRRRPPTKKTHRQEGPAEEGHLAEAARPRPRLRDRHQPDATVRVGRVPRPRRPLTRIRWRRVSCRAPCRSSPG